MTIIAREYVPDGWQLFDDEKEQVVGMAVPHPLGGWRIADMSGKPLSTRHFDTPQLAASRPLLPDATGRGLTGTVTLGAVARRTAMLDIACGQCPRRARLRIARLLAEHGAAMPMRHKPTIGAAHTSRSSRACF